MTFIGISLCGNGILYLRIVTKPVPKLSSRVVWKNRGLMADELFFGFGDQGSSCGQGLYVIFLDKTMCLKLGSSRKYPYPPHGRLLEIPRGRGFQKPNFLKESMALKWNFQRR